ncbi:PH domain-containing protein [Bacillus paranthracis]|uniref:PH domain-containing protein n=1 Tax=Bacillus paranthracis TaxID=2026186 RepID=UPI002E2515F7|nr:PH domain-containing protein [Bacillus paranthracis]MED1681055.1 PH domain-containing protein [Bacillus paranthracis]
MNKSRENNQRLHPVSILYFIVMAIKESLSFLWLFPLLVLLVHKQIGDQISTVQIGVIVSVFLITLFLTVGILKWKSFTYEFHEKAIYIQSGLSVIKKRWVTSDRIQSIDSTIRVYDYFFSTLTLTIELAGGDESSITLSCISKEEERRIRDILQVNTLVNSIEEIDESVLHLSNSDLAFHSFLSPKFGVILTIIVLGLLKYWDMTKGNDQNALVIVLSNWFGSNWIIVTIVLVASISFVLSLLLTFESDYHFTIKKNSKDELEIEQGLLEKKHRTITNNRIQALLIIERPLHRLLGYASIQAVVIRNSQNEQSEKNIAIVPFVKKKKVQTLLESFTDYQKSDCLQLLTKEASFHYKVLPFIVGILIAIPIWLYVPAVYHYLAIIVPFILLLLGWMEYRMVGWNQNEHFLTLQYGSFSRKTVIIKRGRIQWASLRQTTLQEKQHLASLKLAIASGKENIKFSLSHIPVDAANHIYKNTLKIKKEG